MATWLTDSIERELMAQAQVAVPSECAGLIGVNEKGCAILFPCPDSSTTPTSFDIPAQVYWSLRKAKTELVAIYHSHPSGEHDLSTHDLKSMLFEDTPTYPGVEWLIIPCTNDSISRPVRYAWCAQRSAFLKRP
jgi:proteasome lid subunit RPN8/RPN11